ncbi:hypothetical protein AAG570_013584, partial [Ranatra chinensis]
FFLKFLWVALLFGLSSGTDYYELLGVQKTADNREIRRAFKKLAVTLHPDKNQEDPDAHDRFIKITRAYEVLKDDEKRKHYDLFGEDRSSSPSKTQYQSYAYYRDYFGIYDDDPEIITLSHSDFESNVVGSEIKWFINYYSPLCSHCHDLAPTWRSLAKELQGVIMFGAVNCEEDWNLCREQGVMSYPSLIFYPSKEHFYGERRKYELQDFILKKIETGITFVKDKNTWESIKNNHRSWLLILNEINSMSSDTTIIAAILRGLLGVAVIDCDSMSCEEFQDGVKTNSLIYLEKSHDIWSSSTIESDDPQEVMKEVLGLLPSVTQLDDKIFEELISNLQLHKSAPWLIYFNMGPPTEIDVEVKKLQQFLPNFNIGAVNCGRYSKLCADVTISKYPMFGVFKPGGGREFHHGPNLAHSIASFARESASATNIRTLSENEFHKTVALDGGAWFVDFYAPWCPPCLRLLPQLRKASSSFSPETVSFATVDCVSQATLCRSHNIQQYPTTLLFNSTKQPQRFRGSHSASSIVEFVQDLINPSVISLTEETFYLSVGRKSPDSIWMVDFFMPWCGPCQQLAPQYRKLGKMVADLPSVHIAEVNCEVEVDLCEQQGVKSYPNIRLYPLNSNGLNTVALFRGYQRDALSLKRWLVGFLPSAIKELKPDNFNIVTESDSPWLVDFYAPWCGHCVAFEPEFVMLSQKLEGKVLSGKVNCDIYLHLCRSAGVSGYPTVMFYHPRSRKMKGIEIHSQNPSKIIEFVDQMVPSKRNLRDEL